MQGISEALKNVNWEAAFADNDVNENVSKFYQALNETVKDTVPLMRIKSCHFSSWYDSSLKACIFEKGGPFEMEEIKRCDRQNRL